jgi:hypothetical protein
MARTASYAPRHQQQYSSLNRGLLLPPPPPPLQYMGCLGNWDMQAWEMKLLTLHPTLDQVMLQV